MATDRFGGRLWDVVALEVEVPVGPREGAARPDADGVGAAARLVRVGPPQGGRLHGGCGRRPRAGCATKAYLREFLARHGLAHRTPPHDTGHLTRCRRPDSPLARGRTVVAGDAAALCDPWSREGVSFALRSGSWAGAAAADIARADDPADLARARDTYADAVRSTLAAEMAASRQIMNVFTRRPGVVHTALTAVPPVWRRVDAYLGGDTTIPAPLGTPIARTALRAVVLFA